MSDARLAAARAVLQGYLEVDNQDIGMLAVAALAAADAAQWRPQETASRAGPPFLGLLSNGQVAVFVRASNTRPFSYAWWVTSGSYSVPVEETHRPDCDWGETTLRLVKWMPIPYPAGEDPFQHEEG